MRVKHSDLADFKLHFSNKLTASQRAYEIE